MECPCYNCDIRLTELCDHGIKCPNGFAQWKILYTLDKIERNKVLNKEKIMDGYEVARARRARKDI